MALQLTDFFPINRGGTPGTANSGTNYLGTLSGLAALVFGSPALTGVPTAPTPGAGTNTTQLATTAFVAAAVASAVTSVYSLQPVWDASVGTFPGGGAAKIGYLYPVSVAGTVGGKLFNVGDSIIATVNNASTTVFAANWMEDLGGIVSAQVTSALGFTPVNPATAVLTGTPVAPTPTVGTNTTQIATTAFVIANAPSMMSYSAAP